jgi:peptide/nickel transport system substrate-binding protein
VKFSFERAKAEGSTNKAKKAVFDNISRSHARCAHRDPHAEQRRRQLPVPHGRKHRGDPAPERVPPPPPPSRWAPARSSWRLGQGFAVTLVKWDGYRDAAKVKLKKATFRFINDPAAQSAALLAGDIDGMPRFASPTRRSSSSRPTSASRSSWAARPARAS